MSFSDTNCPCGGQKQRETMLCGECVSTFADHPSMATFTNPREPLDARRHAAEILVALAKGRTRNTHKR